MARRTTIAEACGERVVISQIIAQLHLGARTLLAGQIPITSASN